MADPHADEALDALLARYVPGSMLESVGTAALVEHCKRLRTERDKAVEDARFLSECAAKLNYADGLIEEATEAGVDALRRSLRKMFDPLRIEEVTGRYADVEPLMIAEVANG